MKVLQVAPGKHAQVVEIGDALSDLQNAVDGYIEVIYPYEDLVALICNEEGKLLGLELNRALYADDGKMFDIIAGTFLVIGLSEDNFDSLTEEQIAKYKTIFYLPQRFMRFNGNIIAIPYAPELTGNDLEVE